LSARWRVSDHRSGELLIGEEDHSDEIYFVLAGAARSAAFTVNGREVAFTDIGPGDCFGELAAIDHQPRSTSVVALEALRVARLPGRELEALLSRQPELALALLRHISGKLRDLSRRLLEFTALTGQQRVCGELVRLGRKHRSQLDTAVIHRPPTQAELARVVFTTRETVAREMSRLQRGGLLSRTRSQWLIPSLSRLERELSGFA
jgi:CRP-like cAMP-binding protein